MAHAPAGPAPGPSASECWISVDVETSGPNPGSYSLLTIGACRYEDPEAGFAISLQPVGEAADPAALAISGLSLADLAAHGSPPVEAMAAFERWLAEVVPAGRHPVFVGFNAPFDWMFVCDYFHRYLGRNPFGHAAIDIKALAMGLGRLSWAQTSMAALTVHYTGERSLSHDALQDARDQAALLRAILLSHNGQA